MSQPEREAQAATVIDSNGTRARAESTEIIRGEPHVVLRTEQGVGYVVPQYALVELKEGGYFLSTSLDELTPIEAPAARHDGSETRYATTSRDALPGYANADEGRYAEADTANVRAAGDEVLVVPVVAEELNVGKRIVESGRVRITKTVSEREEIVDELLRAEEPVIERVEINRVVDAAPPVRYEGDVMIVPLVEEVLVVERRLMLREELRVSKRAVETRNPQRVILRREEATVERVPAADAAVDPS